MAELPSAHAPDTTHLVGVAQLVEHWLVVPVAAGSSPVIHPTQTEQTDVASALDTPWTCTVWNDPVNLMSYVSYVFRSYFGFSADKAEELMLQVHNNGRAVVATGSREEMERHTEAMHEYGLWATVVRADG